MWHPGVANSLIQGRRGVLTLQFSHRVLTSCSGLGLQIGSCYRKYQNPFVRTSDPFDGNLQADRTRLKPAFGTFCTGQINSGSNPPFVSQELAYDTVLSWRDHPIPQGGRSLGQLSQSAHKNHTPGAINLEVWINVLFVGVPLATIPCLGFSPCPRVVGGTSRSPGFDICFTRRLTARETAIYGLGLTLIRTAEDDGSQLFDDGFQI
ncbi:hypothetical protein V2G26_008339 [Clonostachys chloroleuca]